MKANPGLLTWKNLLADSFIGHLNDFPEYETQGDSKEDLMENLRSLLVDIESGEVPYIRHAKDLVVVRSDAI